MEGSRDATQVVTSSLGQAAAALLIPAAGGIRFTGVAAASRLGRPTRKNKLRKKGAK